MLFDPTNPRHILRARASPAGWAWAHGRGQWQFPPHLDLWNRYALDLLKGDQRILLEGPVRHGKTAWWAEEVAGWYLGCHPDARVVIASYAVSLPQRASRLARAAMAEYGPQVFGVSLSEVSASATDWSLDGHLGGGYFVVGVGGNLMGRGADLLILDDLLDQEGALSDVQRENAWNWLQGNALRRLEPHASVVGISTRYHADDMHGRLLETDRAGWRHVNLPALARDGDPLGRAPGEALWPERYPRERLLEIKAKTPAYWYAALYDGDPIPEGGGIFKSAWCQRRWTQEREGAAIVCGDERLQPSDMTTFVVVDPAVSEKQSADRSAITTLGLTPKGKLLVLDIFAERVADVLPTIAARRATWGATVVWMEDAGQFILLIRAARAAGLPVRCYGRKEEHALRLPSGGGGDPKIPVFHAAAPFMEAGGLWLPRQASWLADAEAELWKAPYAAHDDVAETVAVACLLVQEGLIGGGSLVLSQGRAATAAEEDPLWDDEPPGPFDGMGPAGGGRGW